MTTTAARPAAHPGTPLGQVRRSPAALALLTAGSILALVLALLVGDRTTGGSAMDGMSMTHYMGLLAVRQPWNLLLFMALPVIIAEVLAITEMALLLDPAGAGWVRALNRWTGLLAGPVWVFITVHLLVHAVVPLTGNGGWRGAADVVAVLSYLLGAVPMVGIALLEAGLLRGPAARLARLHVAFVAAFLVVAHVAMIFGMLDPAVLGWHGAGQPGVMPGMDHSTMDMPGMGMSGTGGH